MTLKADEEFVKYLTHAGYHPRSSKHGDKLCELMMADLIDECPAFSDAIAQGRICYDLNYTPAMNIPLGWNVDLAIGPIAGDTIMPSGRHSRRALSELWIAIDAKSIMTEHGKARRNRQRDLNSFATILHMRNPKTIVGGIVVINMATRFRSPLRDGGTTIHANISRLVAECVQIFQDLPLAPSHVTASGNLNQIDAMGVIVIEYSNLEGEPAKLITDPPAPQHDSPIHYVNFVKSICNAFGERFNRT